LTGTETNIRRLTDTVGFGYKYKEEFDPETKQKTYQFMHPTGIVILSPEGQTSLYLLGVQYPAEILMKALKDAKVNKVGPKTETILFGCFMYDGQGKLRPVIQNILMVSGSATVLILFASIGIMSFRHRRSPLYKNGKGGTASV
jgi:protein SCO1/2